jgi:hypothetical protein
MIIFVLASLTEFEHGIIREARVPVPVGRNAHSIWAAEQIVIINNDVEQQDRQD